MRKLTIITVLALLITLAAAYGAFANDVDVYDVSLQNYNPANGTIDIKFSVNQKNIFPDGLTDNNNQNYWDRVWIFVKYWKINSTASTNRAWGHATLSSTGTAGTTLGAYSHSTGIGVTTDGKGVFVKPQRNQVIRWNIGTQEAPATTDSFKVRVFAIEMVYIPTGPFYVGNASMGSLSFCYYGSYPSSYITSENEMTLSEQHYAGMVYIELFSHDIPINMPKGYQGFYIMKYEISQKQYCDFFNTLDSQQQANRTLATGYRNNIGYTTGYPGSASTTTSHVACNQMAWPDLCAYADWAALRPMTELEYEKACRGGNNTPINNECAWGGDTSTAVAAASISNAGLSNETASPTSANCVFGNYTGGPLRGGFAATQTSTRRDSGASYYGVMELSGNLGDMVVQVTASGANKFDGTHGDGTLTFGYTNILTRDGNADNSTWPGYGTYGVTGNGGSMERGSYWKDTSLPDLRVCDRSIVTPSTIPTLGGRCVRTEPH